MTEDAAIDAGASVGGPFLSCESAEEWLNLHSPDVAIIDVRLQDGSSAQLAKKLCGREIPFVVYPVHVSTRKSFGLMTRKLSVTESRKLLQFLGTLSRKKSSVASANCPHVA
jgi:hypothetical protein